MWDPDKLSVSLLQMLSGLKSSTSNNDNNIRHEKYTDFYNEKPALRINKKVNHQSFLHKSWCRSTAKRRGFNNRSKHL